MKKLLITTMTLATIALLFCLSCSKDNDLDLVNQKVALSVKAQIMAGSSVMTKSIIDGELFAKGTNIGVEVVNNSSGGVYQTGARTNIKYTKGGGHHHGSNHNKGRCSSWSASTPFYLTSAVGNIYGYYPYNSNVGTNDEVFRTIPITINSAITTGDETDYMYATPGTCNNDNATEILEMNHALAQVSFYVYKENYSGTGEFTAFKIEDTDNTTSFIKTSRTELTMDITNGLIAGGQVGSLTRILGSTVTL